MRPDPGPPCLYVQPGDLVAVSATNLQALYLPEAVEPLMERLRASRPIAAIGYSIFLYRADFTWLIAPEDAGELDWLEPAAESYAAAIRRDPGLADAHGYLGVALHLQGRHRRAADAFDEAQRLDPDWLGRHRRYEHAFDAAHRKTRQAGAPEREDVVSSPPRRPAPAPLPEG
jgi:tetratricopeptide (TPR) repeat protein